MEKVECKNCGAKILLSTVDKCMGWCCCCYEAYGLKKEDGLRRMLGKKSVDKVKELQRIREEEEWTRYTKSISELPQKLEEEKKKLDLVKIMESFEYDAQSLYRYGSCASSVDVFKKLCIEDKKLLISIALRKGNRDVINVVKWLVEKFSPELKSLFY